MYGFTFGVRPFLVVFTSNFYIFSCVTVFCHYIIIKMRCLPCCHQFAFLHVVWHRANHHGEMARQIKHYPKWHDGLPDVVASAVYMIKPNGRQEYKYQNFVQPRDAMVHIFLATQLVTVKVHYFMPDHRLILNEFVWQTDDLWPTIPRIHKFLNYWKNHIIAPINTVEVQNSCSRSWRALDSLKEF